MSPPSPRMWGHLLAQRASTVAGLAYDSECCGLQRHASSAGFAPGYAWLTKDVRTQMDATDPMSCVAQSFLPGRTPVQSRPAAQHAITSLTTRPDPIPVGISPWPVSGLVGVGSSIEVWTRVRHGPFGLRGLAQVVVVLCVTNVNVVGGVSYKTFRRRGSQLLRVYDL